MTTEAVVVPYADGGATVYVRGLKDGGEVSPGHPEFVVARRDLKTTNAAGIRSTIRAGSLCRRDDWVVRQAPEYFYAPVKHLFHVELSEWSSDGRELGVRTLTHEIEGPPAPPDAVRALREVEKYWADELGKQGYVMSLAGQRTGAAEWVIRCELERAASDEPSAPVAADPPVIHVHVPEQPAPIVNVNIADEPVSAEVRFKRDRQGRLESAKIAEQGGTDG